MSMVTQADNLYIYGMYKYNIYIMYYIILYVIILVPPHSVEKKEAMSQQ